MACGGTSPHRSPCHPSRSPPLQLPLGPSLPQFLLCFHAVNLPFCALNAARLAAARRAGGDAMNRNSPSKLMGRLLQPRGAARPLPGAAVGKLAWE